MSAIHTLACFLLWISLASQDKTPEVTVSCFVSEECTLPCSFKPGSEETVEWFRQDAVVYKFEQSEHDDDGDAKRSSEGGEDDKELAGRASVFTHMISQGNATLTIRRSRLKDRGTYRCHVRTSTGGHEAKVILMVKAPIRGVHMELTRLSGYEEMKCTVRNVFPAPRVTWATEPATFEDLRPVTRMLADKQGLYTVDSRLRLLNGQPDLVYICKVTSSYGGPVWTTSFKEREIKGAQGRDLTIPCSAPSYLNSPSLEWSFSDGEDPARILSYDSRSGRSTSSPLWEGHVELDGFKVQFGDGSLRLMDPKHAEHSGSFVCKFLAPFKTHTERSNVIIDDPVGQRSTAPKPSHWWVFGLVIAGLILALAGMLAYMKLRGSGKKAKNNPEEVTELHSVREPRADTSLNQSGLGAKGQPGLQSGSQLT